MSKRRTHQFPGRITEVGEDTFTVFFDLHNEDRIPSFLLEWHFTAEFSKKRLDKRDRDVIAENNLITWVVSENPFVARFMLHRYTISKYHEKIADIKVRIWDKIGWFSDDD